MEIKTKFNLGDRVVAKKQIVGYVKRIDVSMYDDDNVPDIVNYLVYSNGNSYFCKDKELERYVKPLTDGELSYIKSLIKPFSHRVKTITKRSSGKGKIYLSVITRPNSYDDGDDEITELPSLNETVSFTGMVLNKEYTLKELGL